MSGNISYELNKQLAALAGVTSIKDLQKSMEKDPESSSLAKACFKSEFKETATDFVVSCDLQNANLTEGDFQAKIVDNKIEFTYQANLEPSEGTADSENAQKIEMGKTIIDLTFPGEIVNVIENKKGLVTLIGKNKAQIAGNVSEPFDIKITSNCGVSCGVSMREIASAFREAPKNFSGVIKENLRFTKKNSPYVVKKSIQIPKDKIVYVEPGVTFQSNFPKNGNWENSHTFYLKGKIYFDGTREKPIKLLGKPKVHILTYFAPEGASVTAFNLNVVGGGNFTTNAGEEGYANLKIYDSIFDGLTDYWHIWYPKGENELVRNQFINTGFMDIGFGDDEGSTFKVINNVFKGMPKGSTDNPICWIRNWAAYNSTLVVSGNDFSAAKGPVLCLPAGYDSATIDGSGNYWGTISIKEIKKRVIDSEDSLKYLAEIKVDNPLSKRPVEVSNLRKS